MKIKMGGEYGITLFEMLVMSVVLGVLSLFLFDRVLTYQEMAEKSAVDMTIMNMRTGLRYQMADYLVQNQDQKIAGLVGQNPVKWLVTPPPNYLGETQGQPEKEIARGNWYFDTNMRELCYSVDKGRNFVPAQSNQQILCVHIALLSKGVVGLTPVTQYRWF